MDQAIAEFALLVPIREYLRGRLAAAGEEEAARFLQADCHQVRRGRRRARGRSHIAGGRPQPSRVSSATYAALGWLLSQESRRGVRLATSLFYFWEARYVEEGRRWLRDSARARRRECLAGLTPLLSEPRRGDARARTR